MFGRPAIRPRAPEPSEDQAIARMLDQAEADAHSISGPLPPQSALAPQRKRPVMFDFDRNRRGPVKPTTSLEDVKKKMQVSVQTGEGQAFANARSDLNTYCQWLCKRPTAKGDVVILHQKGRAEVLTMKILPLDLEVSSTFEDHVKLGPLEKKQAEAQLAGAAIIELLSRIEAGELTLPAEPLPLPPVPNIAEPVVAGVNKAIRPGDYKSFLNFIVQKLMPNETDNRIFTVDLNVGYGTLRLHKLDPEVSVECGLMDLDEDTELGPDGRGKTPVTSRFEHTLAHLALNELVSRGTVTYDETDPTAHRYWPAGRVKPPSGLKSVPLPSAAAPAAAKRLSGTHRLREWQATWKPAESDVAVETCKCRPDGFGGKTWEVTISLKSEELTGGQQIEGNGASERKEVAFDEAAEELMLQIEEVLGIMPPEPAPAPVQEQRGVKRPFSGQYVPAGRNNGGKGYKGGGKGFTQGYQRPYFAGRH